ncbi:hypothetical protein [Nocardia africana]|uniref:Uncharacterized protein n=1 Tax=Nocardia africana TaxID=134964 RepID=A0ABW6N9G3_9NOCA
MTSHCCVGGVVEHPAVAVVAQFVRENRPARRTAVCGAVGVQELGHECADGVDRAQRHAVAVFRRVEAPGRAQRTRRGVEGDPPRALRPFDEPQMFDRVRGDISDAFADQRHHRFGGENMATGRARRVRVPIGLGQLGEYTAEFVDTALRAPAQPFDAVGLGAYPILRDQGVNGRKGRNLAAVQQFQNGTRGGRIGRGGNRQRIAVARELAGADGASEQIGGGPVAGEIGV